VAGIIAIIIAPVPFYVIPVVALLSRIEPSIAAKRWLFLFSISIIPSLIIK
jgi:hypothetical protein